MSKYTAIDSAKIENLVSKHGLKVELKAQWVKVSGNKGRNMYIPLKTSVTRIDLSGFENHVDGFEGVVKLEKSYGSVEHIVDMTRTEDEILETIDSLFALLVTMPPRASLRRTGKSQSNHQGASWVTQAQTQAALAPIESEAEAAAE